MRTARLQLGVVVALVLAFVFVMSASATSPNPSKYRWNAAKGQPATPKVRIDANADKPPPLGFGPGATNAITKAIEEWCNHNDTKKSPSSGKGKNPKNNTQDGVMDEGSAKKIAAMLTKQGKFRSFTDAERKAITTKYPDGFCPTVWKKGDPAPLVEVKPWSGTQLLRWKRPADTPGGTPMTQLAVKLGEDIVYTKFRATVLIGPDPLVKANGVVRPVKWFIATDTNKDGRITNADAGPPAGADKGKLWLDFYSIVKHELGHAFSLLHSTVPANAAEGQSQVAGAGVSISAIGGQRYVVTQADITAALGSVLTASAEQGGAMPDVNIYSGARIPGLLVFSSDRAGGQGGHDLYYALTDGATWSAPVNFGPAFNTASDELDPYLAEGGSELYFSSNRGGGSGGYDLYSTYSATADSDLFEGWTAPELITAVNSTGNDRSPSLSPDQGTLWFASDGPGGQGGLDVWQSAWGTTGWQSPVNPGTPLNGAGNDRDPFFASDDLLYFASDRAGGQGGYDF